MKASLPLGKKVILKDLLKDLNPKIARDIAASLNCEVSIKLDMIPGLIDMLNKWDDSELSEIFNIVIIHSATYELHAVVVSHVTLPGSPFTNMV